MPSQWLLLAPNHTRPNTPRHAASAPKLVSPHAPPPAAAPARFSPAPPAFLPDPLCPSAHAAMAPLSPLQDPPPAATPPPPRHRYPRAVLPVPLRPESMSRDRATPPGARARPAHVAPTPPGASPAATAPNSGQTARQNARQNAATDAGHNAGQAGHNGPNTGPYSAPDSGRNTGPSAAGNAANTAAMARPAPAAATGTAAAAADPLAPPDFAHYDHSAFLLDHLDPGYYGQPPGAPDFSLDALDFMAPAGVGHGLHAYPPLAFVENTPHLAAAGAALFLSPVLPSQDSRLYNQEHFQHKQRQQRSRLLAVHGFSPLVSPAATPADAHVNSNKLAYAPAATDFEPLTSPALKAQLQAAAPAPEPARRRSLAVFAADGYAPARPAKRRTPHLTPTLLAKPTLAPRTHYDPPPEHYEPRPFDPPLMRPPQGKKTPVDAAPPALGPGTLMGFTMNRLAALQASGPAAAAPPPPGSSLSDTSPVLEAMGGELAELAELAGRRDRVPGKKTSHKIAEQGRRVRMNQAVHELSRLIPQTFQEGITVPSKATTIELAAVYIRNLQREIAALKHGRDA